MAGAVSQGPPLANRPGHGRPLGSRLGPGRPRGNPWRGQRGRRDQRGWPGRRVPLAELHRGQFLLGLFFAAQVTCEGVRRALMRCHGGSSSYEHSLHLSVKYPQLPAGFPLSRKRAQPHTSLAVSTISRSLAACSSGVSTLPSTVEEKPHWGDRHSWSSGTYLAASSIRRLSASLDSSSPRLVVTRPSTP